MTAPETTPPRSDAGAGADAPITTPRPRALQVTAVAAFVGVLIALGGIAYVSTPLQTPTQDCGTAATFLIDGRLNIFANPEDPPAGSTSADVQANNDEPCQERAANRALPGALVIFAGTLIGIGALAYEVIARMRLARRTRDSLMAADPHPGAAPQARSDHTTTP